MRVLELFSGYGSQALALENLGIEFTSDISEIDQYAIKAYNQIHGDTHNWGDINKIDETKLPYYDLITYSSPCQDFSVAGLGKGGDKDSGTRSSLLWECERIIRAVKPKYLLMENVKNLVGEKHKHNFIRWLRVLEMMGYWNFWQVLNAKDYGVPQNRERVFVVSILGGGQYLFPNKIKLEKRLKDILEPVVDEKYYLSNKMVEGFLKHNDNHLGKTGFVWQPRVMQVGNIVETDSFGGNPQRGRIYSADGCSPALNTMQGGGLEPKIVTYDIPQTVSVRKYEVDEQKLVTILREGKQKSGLTNNQIAEKLNLPMTMVEHWFRQDSSFAIPNADIWQELKALLGVKTDEFDLPITEFEEKEGVFEKANRCYGDDGLAPTLTSTSADEKVITNYRIRKLTPRECWRLMGVKDEQYDKLHDISNTQLYKMAGNSIVVDVLMGIFKNLFLSDEGTSGQLTLF